MFKQFTFIRQFLVATALAVVMVTAPTFQLAGAQTPVPAPPQEDVASIDVDGYTVTEKDTSQVNSFLAAHPARAQFLANLTARGVDPAAVKYIGVSSSPAQGGTDDLSVLAGRLNEYQSATGGSPVTSVDMLIGGYQGAGGALDGEVLLVAHLANGSQSLVSAVQADDAALSGATNPQAMNGDFFGGGSGDGAPVEAQAAVQAIAVAIICWITCIVIQQIIIILRCIVIAIVVCIRIGPFLLCLWAKIVICQLIIIVRTIIICFINCVLIVVIPVFKVAPRAQQPGDGSQKSGAAGPPRFGPGGKRGRLGTLGRSSVPLTGARLGLAAA
jgi:hypothetical protein